MIHEIPLLLPRHAFSARDACRAGDVWRAFQDAAVVGSTRAGWPPSRYRANEVAFVVRQMTTVHHREACYGESAVARTWVDTFRRGLLIFRQIRLDGDRGPIASTTQEWAHVKVGPDRMRPRRASQELQDAFAPVAGEPHVELPAFDEQPPGPEHELTFRAWHTAMDPLAHANHPAYVDWCDEALSVVMERAGLEPLALQPVAEWVKWRLGVEAPAQVSVRTRLIGRTSEGDVVCEHLIGTEAEPTCATARTVRRLVGGGAEALAHALG